VGLLSTWGILGLIIMYLMANVALVVDFVKFRRGGVSKSPLLWVVVPLIGIVVLAIPVWGDLRPGQPSPLNNLPWLTALLILAESCTRWCCGSGGPPCCTGPRPCSRARMPWPSTRCRSAATSGASAARTSQ
jgi:hypothetical protein